MITNIVSFVIVLGVLIFVHEFGHFIFAKLMGVGVEKFSLGFGPRILGKKVGLTDYRLSAIPLGGYVKMVGEAPDSELEPSMVPLSFSHKSVLKRSLIVFAGPCFNFLLSVVVFFGFFIISGLPMMMAEVGTVQDGMPAQEAGLQAGDRVVSVDGESVTQWDDMAGLIQERGDHPLVLEILRNDAPLKVTVTPKKMPSKNVFGEDIHKYVIGITASNAFTVKHMGVIESLVEGVVRTCGIVKLTIVSVGKMMTGSLSAKNLGGPIMIAQLSGESARAGITNFIFFIALLSVNLGILNLLPIPILDGGHLLFFAIEAVGRKPVNLKMREVAQQIGMFVLILLMVFVFYNDIARMFN